MRSSERFCLFYSPQFFQPTHPGLLAALGAVRCARTSGAYMDLPSALNTPPTPHPLSSLAPLLQVMFESQSR